LKDQDNIWIQAFDTVQDIKESLNELLQTALLESLSRQLAESGEVSSPVKTNLDIDSLRFATEKPVAWEVQFFNRIFQRELEITKLKQMMSGVELEAASISGLSKSEIINCVENVISGIDRLRFMVEEISEYIEPQNAGVATEEKDGNVIVFLSNRLAQHYRKIRDYSVELQRFTVTGAWKEFVELAMETVICAMEATEAVLAKTEKEPLCTVTATAQVESLVHTRISRLAEDLDTSGLKTAWEHFKKEL